MISTSSAEILEQSMGARNRVGKALSYRWSARLHRLAESIPGHLKSLKITARAYMAGRFFPKEDPIVIHHPWC